MNEVKILTKVQFAGFILPVAVFVVPALSVVMLSSCVPADSSPKQAALHRSAALPGGKKIPVIFDTDIGDDIDDTWALALLLQSPELDIKLITVSVNEVSEKARIVAKILDMAGRTDIPIGIGVPAGKTECAQKTWAKDYELKAYPGRVYEDGVKALIDTVMNSPEPITVIAVGPLPNIAAALEREPRIADKARFIGMHGSIRRGYEGSEKTNAEYNVKAFPKGAQKVFTAGWDIMITPLDTCGIVTLEGERYQKVRKRGSPLTEALMGSYRVWLEHQSFLRKEKFNVETGSTILYDTVAIYLAVSTELVKIERLGIRVNNIGYTLIDDKAKKINCATEWKDLEGFKDFLVERLTK